MVKTTGSGNLKPLKSQDQIEAEQRRIEEKKRNAGSMVFRHLVEKKDLATCWFEVYPESDATRTKAKRMAGRHIQWFRLTFPIEIRQLLHMKGYDDTFLIDEIAKQLQATTLVKKRTRKFKMVDEEGKEILVEEIDYIDAPDHKTHADALQKLITLHGFHGRALKQAERNIRNVTEPQDIVHMEKVEKLPDEEWQRQYQQVIAESNADEKANAMLRDLEKRIAEREAQERTHKRP